MAHLFIEFLCEEIPALMQKRARKELLLHAETLFKEFGLEGATLKTYSTPRRLVLVAEGLPLSSPDRVEEKKGPRVDGPALALEGFFKTHEVTAQECKIEETQKGTFYILEKTIPGKETQDILPEIVQLIVQRFSWPKSMAWGSSERTWVRPLQSGLCFLDETCIEFNLSFGPNGETFEKFVPFGSTTVGHRLLAPERFEVHGYNDYREKLQARYVILDHEEREKRIEDQIQSTLNALGSDITLVRDDALLEEVVGLVEWPVVLKGSIEEAFRVLPAELLMTTMRVHQRYFATRDATGALSPYFLIVSNQIAPDQGRAIVHGNQRVLRARLNDAKFFYENDLKVPLLKHAEKLKSITFYQKLGTLFDKSERIVGLSALMAPMFQLDPKDVEATSKRVKADLVTEMVKEFPELQGVMGKYYARAEGLNDSVQKAIEEHYQPRFAEDHVPTAPLSQAIALADRLDTLVGFFAIGVKPTGSKDPFALRRACLGIIRLLEHNREVSVDDLLSLAFDQYVPLWIEEKTTVLTKKETLDSLRLFFMERLRVYYKESGIRHDYFNAAISVGAQDPLGILKARILSIRDFLEGQSADGQNLLSAYRRANNMLRIEEKKDGQIFNGTVNPELLLDNAEKKLFEQLETLQVSVERDLSRFDFEQVMQKLSHVRPAVDAYFDEVTVNHSDQNVRLNRLHTLALLRRSMEEIVDFSKIEES